MTWRLLLAGTLVSALLLLAACGTDDEVLALSPIPGASDGDRVGARSVRLFDDPEALRRHANEHTVAIILPGERLDELGSDWLHDRYVQGVTLIVLNIPQYPLLDMLSIPRNEPSEEEIEEMDDILRDAERINHEGFRESYYILLKQACREDGEPGYPRAGGGHYEFNALRMTLDGQLGLSEPECA